MDNEVFRSFHALFIDYHNRLRQLEVLSAVGHDRLFYFACIIDEVDFHFIRVGEDGRWHDRMEGPTVLADELGSIIESQMWEDNE